MADYLPKFKPGQAITRTATATLVGGQLVTVAGAVAGATALDWLGVAANDAASGQLFGCYMEGVQNLIPSAAITAGSRVKCAANGQIVTWVSGTDVPDSLVGIALEAATGAATPATIAVKLTR